MCRADGLGRDQYGEHAEQLQEFQHFLASEIIIKTIPAGGPLGERYVGKRVEEIECCGCGGGRQH